MSNCVAIVPARGGSIRIPRKNVKLFAGLPMIAHSLRAARAAGVFDRIVVSTDDEQIAAVAREHGAEVPFLRPASLAHDFAGTDAVIAHTLGWFAEQGTPVEEFCCIYATAPFVDPADIRRGRDVLREHRAATAFSVTTFPSCIFRALRRDERGAIKMFWPENFSKRSQDFPEAYHDAAQFYWGNTERYRAEGRLFSSTSVPVIVPRARVQDIDTPEDWEVAERMFQAMAVGATQPATV